MFSRLNSIGKTVGSVRSSLGETVRIVGTSLEETIGSVGNSFEETIGSVGNSLGATVDSVGNSVCTTIESIGECVPEKSKKSLENKARIIGNFINNPFASAKDLCEFNELKTQAKTITKLIRQCKVSPHFDKYRLIEQTVKYIGELFKVLKSIENVIMYQSNRNIEEFIIPQHFINFCKRIYHWMPSLRSNLEQIPNISDQDNFFEMPIGLNSTQTLRETLENYSKSSENLDLNLDLNLDSDSDLDSIQDDEECKINSNLYSFNFGSNFSEEQSNSYDYLIFDEDGVLENEQKFIEFETKFKLLVKSIEISFEHFDSNDHTNTFELCENVHMECSRLKKLKMEIKAEIGKIREKRRSSGK